MVTVRNIRILAALESRSVALALAVCGCAWPLASPNGALADRQPCPDPNDMCPQLTSASGAASVEAFWHGGFVPPENDFGPLPATVAWTTVPADEHWHMSVPANSTIQSMDVEVLSPAGQQEEQLPSVPYNLGPGQYDGGIKLLPGLANGVHVLELSLHGQFYETTAGCPGCPPIVSWYPFTDTRDYWLRVDAQPPPAAPSAHVLQGDGWHNSANLSVQVALPREDPATQAPITGVWFKLCRAIDRGDCTLPQRLGITDPTASVVTIPTPAPNAGDRLADIWLEDVAGNRNEGLFNDDAHVRYDPDAPRVAFIADDQSDPTNIEVQASDATSSVGDGEIDYQVQGSQTWHQLPTTVTQSRLSARFDDSVVHKDATVRFRAVATDLAGNSAATTQLAGGGDFVLTAPLREATRLGLSARHTLRAARKSCHRSGGHRRCETVLRPPSQRHPSSLRLAFGQRKRLHGLLTTDQGHPITGAGVNIAMTDEIPGATAQTVVVHTNHQGQFSYVVPAGPSRAVTVAYGGGAHLQPTSRRLRALTRGRVTLTAHPRSVRVPGRIQLSGRVHGGPLPPDGKLVTLQAWVGHHWQPFATVHTDATGGFHYVEAIRHSPSGIYRLRATLPREAAFAYAGGASRVARVHVR